MGDPRLERRFLGGRGGDDEAPRSQQVAWGKKIARQENANYDCILALFEKHGRRYSARNLATSAHRVAKCAGKRKKGLQDVRMKTLAEACRRRIDEFEPQHLSNTAWAYATVGFDAPDLFAAIADAAVPQLFRFSSQELTNTAWAFATAGVEAPLLFDCISRTASPRLKEFKSQELANLVWAFAKHPTTTTPTHSSAAGGKLSMESLKHLFNAVAEHATARRRLADFNPQDLSSTAWSFAIAGIYAPELFHAIATASLGRLHLFGSQSLANAAWAFASSGVGAPELFDSIATATTARLQQFNPQEISNTTWAFAKAGVNAPALFEGVARATTARRLAEFSAQNITNMVWAFAVMSSRDETLPKSTVQQLFDVVAAAVVARTADFKPQEIANTVWAFATSGVRAPSLYDAVGKYSAIRIDDFTPQSIAGTSWAFSTAGEKSPELFEAVSRVLRKNPRRFSAQQLASVSWAFATAGFCDVDLSEAVSAETSARLVEFDPEALANVACAYAHWKTVKPSHVDTLHDTLVALVAQWDVRDDASLAKVYTFILFVQINHPQIARSRALDPEELERLRKAYTLHSRWSSSPSNKHQTHSMFNSWTNHDQRLASLGQSLEAMTVGGDNGSYLLPYCDAPPDTRNSETGTAVAALGNNSNNNENNRIAANMTAKNARDSGRSRTIARPWSLKNYAFGHVARPDAPQQQQYPDMDSMSMRGSESTTRGSECTSRGSLDYSHFLPANSSYNNASSQWPCSSSPLQDDWRSSTW